MLTKSVDSYLAQLSNEQRAIAAALRAAVSAAAPGATETIKWSQPVFELNGPICWIKAHKAHVTLGFWRGMQLQAGKGIVEGRGSKMGHLKLRSLGDVKPALVKKLVRDAVSLNREMGDPTKTK